MQVQERRDESTRVRHATWFFVIGIPMHAVKVVETERTRGRIVAQNKVGVVVVIGRAILTLVNEVLEDGLGSPSGLAKGKRERGD